MDPEELCAYQERLEALREDCRSQLEQRARAVREQTRTPEAASDLPTHPEDRDSEGLAPEVEMARIHRSVYDRVNAALERISTGRFGICDRCGGRISRERLDAVPYAQMCAVCATAEEG
jgi:DnaK suppressor protein